MCLEEQKIVFCYPLGVKQQGRVRAATKGESSITYNPKKRVGRDVFSKWIKEIARDAGVAEWKRVSCDVFRPYAMSKLSNDPNVTPKMVANAARHSNMETQKFYVRPDSAQQVAAANALAL